LEGGLHDDNSSVDGSVDSFASHVASIASVARSVDSSISHDWRTFIPYGGSRRSISEFSHEQGSEGGGLDADERSEGDHASSHGRDDELDWADRASQVSGAGSAGVPAAECEPGVSILESVPF
jgi:hypothetical protein